MKSASMEMTEIYGKQGMAKAATREELYECFDTLAAAIRSHKSRLEVLEVGKSTKPRVRVPAGSRAYA